MSGALCFVYALRYRADSDKTFGLTPTRGASHSLRSLCSFNEQVRLGARFGDVACQVRVPMLAVLAVYARENGRGTTFPVEDESTPPAPPKPPPQRPKLRVVK